MRTTMRQVATMACSAALALSVQPLAQEAKQPAFASYRVHDSKVSRQLFGLCDRNRDDRLSFREARASLGLDSPQSFRPCDRNNDGWLHFGEFDCLYRRRVERGKAFIIMGKAAEQAPPEPVKVSQPVKEIFQTLDSDRNGTVSPTEWRSAPPTLAQALSQVPGGFINLDRNGSHLLELEELKRLETFFPQLVARNRAVPPADPRTLPVAYQAADRNSNQVIEPTELLLLLNQVAPALAPQAGILFQRVDRNGDGLITPREIRQIG